MAYTDASIASMALQELGDRPIVSLTEDSDRARLCNQFYAQSRDAVLRAHPWNFAVTRKSLAKLATNAIDVGDGLTGQFPVPTDALRILDLSFDSPRTRWHVEYSPDSSSKVIVTDSTTVNVRYIKRIEDPAQFDPLFVEALIALLASRLAIPIKSREDIETAKFALYKVKLAEARTMDGMEGSPRSLDVGDFVRVRLGGGGSNFTLTDGTPG